jgi:hypothetical protein
MRSDSDIKRDVEDELQWDPDIDATDIAVAVGSPSARKTITDGGVAGLRWSPRRRLKP